MHSLIENRRFYFDILRIPGLRQFLLWKHSRSLVQWILFALAAAIIVDGLLGTQIAPKNVATVSAWVHYRGLVVLALLVVGNLFCAACPFILPRRVAKWIGNRLGVGNRRWPRQLRNKWLALAGLVGIIYVYELFDLWASPWWTAWLAVAYFATAFVLEAFFTRNSFCMYVCPLGTFNFLYSTASPMQITSRSLQTCRDCVGRECINGSTTQQGCQLELFVPTIQSNMNCTLCLDCVKACPHDNVALAMRPPGDELFRQTWPRRLDLALLAIITATVGLLNAFAMTPPVYEFELQLGAWLGTESEAIVLGIIYVVGAILAPLALVYAAAWLSQKVTRTKTSLNRFVMRYAYSFVAVGFAIWLAHYLFHFLTGMMTIIPAFQTFFQRTLGLAIFGRPDWTIATLFVPAVSSIQLLQTVITYGGLLAAIAMALGAARKAQDDSRVGKQRAIVEALPWLVLLIGLAVASGATFLLPMEMRGSALGG
ncbi:MAG: hypothetical protein AAF639_00245 [Chloroflexota bacterium]